MTRDGAKGAWNEALRCEEPDELRVVSVRRWRGGVQVRERTDGVATWLAFGALTCVRVLEVGAGKVTALAEALGCGVGEWPQALAAFLSVEGRSLADLQDLLDARGVAYAYRVRCGNGFALRSAA